MKVVRRQGFDPGDQTLSSTIELTEPLGRGEHGYPGVGSAWALYGSRFDQTQYQLTCLVINPEELITIITLSGGH